ncbi:MAG: hypothetical protein A2X54_05715 [Nitrospirae bacterium GWF2_44_13]|nr:MAG: hypothetical protein A2X54_05715 [Nitrospirae bacterium GWF2_44_13]OGW66092.1 MAG: hypothetical protein A2222_09750 [Nitrospirae bacterium RIFOXYA2_FULL_44_9]HBG93484.1 hypothetical protein [Nitrospiraceae bacterium]
MSRIQDKKKMQDTRYMIHDKEKNKLGILHLDNKGFSLIEIIMIIIVVSIAIPALLILVGGEAGRGVEPELRITATNVAQQLMDEIMTKCWDETATTTANCGGTVSYSDLGIDGGETAGTLSTYDDVDDYTTGGVPAVVIPAGGVSYSRSVVVCYVPYNDLTTTTCNTTAVLGTDYKRIAVTVTRGDTTVTLTTVMTNY